MEFELKFRIEPREHEKLGRSAALAGAKPRRRLVDTTYFDTPEAELLACGVVLRLRRVGGRWIEGLKGGNAASGAVHLRAEWEFERDGPGIDLWRYADTPLARVKEPATLHERLQPAFRVLMRRTTWRLEAPGGGGLEVALDDGWVDSHGRRERISEVEIESLGAPPAAAFALARSLIGEGIALAASPISKAERGYRLFRREKPAARKARAVTLDPGASIGAAARLVIGAGLDQFLRNEPGMLRSSDPEFVHQGRVALRRLRAALQLFREVVGRERAEAWRITLRELARALGEARDWDVFALETLPAAFAAHGDAATAAQLAPEVARRRARARARARRKLRATRHALALLEIAAWVSAEPETGEAERWLAGFAGRALRKRHRRLLEDARGLETLGAEERHQLRVDAKRLRYGTDSLASLFPAGRADHYLGALSDLQDVMGEANDAANAMRLLETLSAPPAFEAFARGHFGDRATGDTHRMEQLIGDLEEHRPWR